MIINENVFESHGAARIVLSSIILLSSKHSALALNYIGCTQAVITILRKAASCDQRNTLCWTNQTRRRRKRYVNSGPHKVMNPQRERVVCADQWD